jgi:hypothetical protein
MNEAKTLSTSAATAIGGFKSSAVTSNGGFAYSDNEGEPVPSFLKAAS